METLRSSGAPKYDPLFNLRMVLKEVERLSFTQEFITSSDVKRNLPYAYSSIRKHLLKLVDLGCLEEQSYIGRDSHVKYKYRYLKGLDEDAKRFCFTKCSAENVP